VSSACLQHIQLTTASYCTSKILLTSSNHALPTGHAAVLQEAPLQPSLHVHSSDRFFGLVVKPLHVCMCECIASQQQQQQRCINDQLRQLFLQCLLKHCHIGRTLQCCIRSRVLCSGAELLKTLNKCNDGFSYSTSAACNSGHYHHVFSSTAYHSILCFTRTLTP
jgi:hypothetical protein